MIQKIKILCRGLTVLVLLLGLTQTAAADTGGTTELISQTTTGAHGSPGSSFASVSHDANRVVFSSEEDAAELVSGAVDSNDSAGSGYRWDVFLRLRGATPATYLLSRYRENLGEYQSFLGAISPDGQFAVFQSDASDVDFVHPCGLSDPTTTAGVFQVYLADLRNLDDISLYLVSRRRTITDEPDPEPDICTWVEGNADSGKMSLIQGGTYFPAAVNVLGDNLEVIFQSRATNLVDGDAGGGQDLYYYRANVNQLEAGSVGIVTKPMFMLDEALNSGYFRSPSLSADGLTLALVLGESETESDGQVYLLDRDIDSDGILDDQDLDMNDDGNLDGTTPNDPFIPPGYRLISRNWETGESGDGVSSNPAISLDLGTVVFASTATNLLEEAEFMPDNNTARDVFRFDLNQERMTLVSLNSAATGAANGDSYFPSVSATGDLIVFQSSAADLVAADTDVLPDVFLYRDGIVPLSSNDIVLLSVNNSNQNSGFNSVLPRLSRNGQVVVFTDYSSNMPDELSGATQGVGNIYARLITHDPVIDTTPRPVLAVSPANWNFGLVGDDGTDKKVIRVMNVGDDDLILTAIDPFVPEAPFSFLTEDPNNPDVSLNNCVTQMKPEFETDPLKPVTLQPMQSCYIHLTFTVQTFDPTGYDTSYYTMVVDIFSNDPDNPVLEMKVSGGAESFVYLPVVWR